MWKLHCKIYLNNNMKTMLKIFTLALIFVFSIQSVFAETCLDLEKGKENQLKRLETAKVKIFEQDAISLKAVKEKQAEKVAHIREKTAARVLELEIILNDLQALPDQSETIQNTIKTISENLTLYSKNTESSLEVFSSGVDKTLDEKTKAIKNVVQQYEAGVIQLYDKALVSCKKSDYSQDVFDQDLKAVQKRVLDAEKNSKRILQGIDSLYASLSLELDKSDISLNLVLKSIQVSLLENPPKGLKPLSLFRLWKML